MPEGLLTVLKFCFLALLYLFLFRVVRIVRLELKPAKVAVPAAAVARRADRRGAGRQPSEGEAQGARWRAAVPAGAAGARRARSYPLTEEVTVGRAPGCGVVLDDDTFVSQVHARLFRRGRETYVEDLGSTNGTLVNGVRIAEVDPLCTAATRSSSAAPLAEITDEPRRA